MNLNSIDELNELMIKEEAVCDELAPYVMEDPRFGKMLKHPLMFVIIGFDPNRSGLWNRQFHEKKKMIAQWEEEGLHDRALWMYERAHRLEYFSKIASKLDDQKYWEMLGHIITDSENLWQYLSLLKVMLAMPRPGKQFMMDDNEKKALAKLPDEIQIWRGCIWKNRNGLSWSINKTKAIWFATRFGTKKPMLHSGTVNKSDVIAYFTGRGEDEILVLPNRIKNKSLEKI